MNNITDTIPCSSTDLVIFIIGPSGSGKSAVSKILEKNGFVYMNRSYTTRPKRHSESDDTHVYISESEFQKRIDEGYFLEVAQPFELKYRYGVPKLYTQKGKVALVLLRSRYVKKGLHLFPNAVIYHIEAPVSHVKKVLQSRDAETGTRLSDYRKECQMGRKYANRVFVNNSTMNKLVSIISSAMYEDFNNTLNS